MAFIKRVGSDSPFFKKIKKGDDLIKINGKVVGDFLDYMYFTSDLTDQNGDFIPQNISVTVNRNGKELTFTEYSDYGDLSIDFEDDLMDDQKSCHNKCIFCFIDQMPKNMRETLYYKDDDFRLSLIYGNYITMTNLSDSDIDRIIRYRISPLNISVHTTNPELRVKMMANPRAAEINKNLRKIYEAGLNIRCQIVLCKGINDGEELTRSMEDLKKLYPSVTSVSIVPVGLTKFRDGLYPLEIFEKDEAAAVLEQINNFGDKCVKELGTRLFYPSDEFFLKSGTPLPDCGYYENFEQTENGVGMTTLFIDELNRRISEFSYDKTKKADISLVTGMLTENLIKDTANRIAEKFPNIKINVFPIKNDFFGEKITVTGLVTGQDIIKQLKNKTLGDYLFIPEAMLKDGDTFLDDITLSDMAKALKVKTLNSGSSAEELLDTVISVCKKQKKHIVF